MQGRKLGLVVIAAVAGVGLVAALQLAAAETTHVVKLGGNRFTPGEIVVRPGDSLHFVNGGGMHNVAFREDNLAREVRQMIDAVLPGRDRMRTKGEAPLAGPFLINEGDVYAFPIPALPPGRYEFFCAPHMGAGMKGTLVVSP